MKAQILFALMLTLLATQAHGTLALRGKCFKLSQIDGQKQLEQGIEIDFAHMDFLAENLIEDPLTVADVQQAIPLTMTTTNDGVAVEQSIAKHMGNNLVKSDYLKNLKFLKTAEKIANRVEQAASLKVKMSESKNQDASKNPKSVVDLVKAPEKINHELDFKLQALKNEARIIYSGFVDSSVTYYNNTHNLIIEAHKSLTPSSSVSISHQNLPEGKIDSIAFSYQW